MHTFAVTIGGWDITAQYLFRGFIEGLTYGMVALGLVLIYKASGVINFAQGQFGAFGLVGPPEVPFDSEVPEDGGGRPVVEVVGPPGRV